MSYKESEYLIIRAIRIHRPVVLYFMLIPIILSVFFCHPFMAYSEITGTRRPLIEPSSSKIILGFRQQYFDAEKQIYRKHTGIDIQTDYGEKIFASGNGTVSYIGLSPIGGRTVVIRHNEKLRTTYLNLMEIFVTIGQTIQQGDIIAVTGTIDDPSSQGACLHFGVIFDNYYLDPEDLLKIDYRDISCYLLLRNIKPDFYFE
jgi:murein DD-endopeptidase MepM/ murein hydrolase activator NlpD